MHLNKLCYKLQRRAFDDFRVILKKVEPLEKTRFSWTVTNHKGAIILLYFQVRLLVFNLIHSLRIFECRLKQSKK